MEIKYCLKKMNLDFRKMNLSFNFLSFDSNFLESSFSKFFPYFILKSFRFIG